MTNQKSGVSALGLQRLLGLGSYESAWTCLHKLRSAMIRPERELLVGPVEVDETLVGGVSRGGRGRSRKILIGMAAEVRGKASGRIRLEQLPDGTSKSLIAFVQRTVAAGSEVITDGNWGYAPLARLGYTYKYHVLDGKGREASALLLGKVHRVASLLKRWLLGIHQGKASKLQITAYLEEFAFRYNRRMSPHRGMLFYRLAEQSVKTKPLPYGKLIVRGRS